jgi:hypothetical protein
VPTIFFSNALQAVAHPIQPGFYPFFNPLLDPLGMAEARLQNQLLGGDQLLHVRLD